jgi:hypothetical protein
MANLFVRATRYGASAPENRLTQVFATGLDNTEGLAYDLATRWLSDATSASERAAPAGSRAALALTRLKALGQSARVRSEYADSD